MVNSTVTVNCLTHHPYLIKSVSKKTSGFVEIKTNSLSWLGKEEKSKYTFQCIFLI